MCHPDPPLGLKDFFLQLLGGLPAGQPQPSPEWLRAGELPPHGAGCMAELEAAGIPKNIKA